MISSDPFLIPSNDKCLDHHMAGFLIIISLLISVVITIIIPPISCQTPRCRNNTFFIHYPFHLLEENQNYPDHRHFKTEFILRCNNNGSAVLNLPFSGDFYVRGIDYFEQKIQLYDPGNCLPGRLMHNFSLPASSSFWLVSYKSYTFFRCPTGNLTNDDDLSVIGCLSNSTASVLATTTNSTVSRVKKGCKTIASNLEIPDLDYEYKAGSKGDLVLAWYDPSCGEDCKGKPHSKSVIKIIIVCLITISTAILGALFCIACCLRLVGKVLHIDEERTSPILALHPSRTRRHTFHPNGRAQTSGPDMATDPQAHNDHEFRFTSYQNERAQTSGPDMATDPQAHNDHEFRFTSYQNERAQTSGPNIDTGPQAHNGELQFASSTEEMIIGGAEWISGPNSDSCPICLGEYQASDKLRRVCECDHCFHAHCLEMWFKRKSTCPVCRISVK